MGDYSKLPNWLFPKMNGFQTFAPMVPLAPAGVTAPQAGSTLSTTGGNPYSSGTK
jgi:hypothetical protein